MHAYLAFGLMEGPGSAKKMIRELELRGYDIVQNPSEADLLIAHSGG